MARKKRMTPAQKASARWEEPSAGAGDGEGMAASGGTSQDEPDGQGPSGEPANGDHFVISLALIGVVAIAAIVYTTMQGGVPF